MAAAFPIACVHERPGPHVRACTRACLRTLGGMSESSDFSYRSDARVPAFDDRFPIALMDAECALCCIGARMIDRLDRSGEIGIGPVPTVLGRALLGHYGLRVDSPETWLLLERVRALGGFEAMTRVGERSGGCGRALSVLRNVQRALRHRIYK